MSAAISWRARTRQGSTRRESASPGARRWGVPHILIFLYILTKPLYLWSSGLPQVADAFLLLLIGHTMLSRREEKRIAPWSHPLTVLTAVFAYWSLLVNLAAAIGVGIVSPFLVSTAMNVYNAAVVVAMFVLVRIHHESMVRALYLGALASIGLQFALLVSGVVVGGGVRAAGTFNNPNQLAFHGLLVLSILIVSHHLISAPVALTIAGMAVAVTCVAASLSRSGLIAVAVVLIGAVLKPPGSPSDRRKFRALAALALTPIAVVASTTDIIRSSEWFQGAYARATKLEPEGFETNRGYDRIADHPQYWIFGAGDGAYSRFGPHEFHSTLGNIQLSYGVIGLLLYLVILWVSLRGGGRYFAYVLLGTVVYGLAHNGLRSSVAWILLVLLVSVGSEGFRTPTSRRSDGDQSSARHPAWKTIGRRKGLVAERTTRVHSLSSSGR